MIITISGQYGSGGNEVGIRLAELLNYRMLDAQLVIRAREIYTAKSGSGEKPSWWPSRYNMPFYEEDDIPAPGTAYEQAEFKLKTDLIDAGAAFDDLGPESEGVRRAMLEAQSESILEYVESGNCIILGKCSNFVLRDRKDAVHVFATADLDVRINRIMHLYNITMDKVRGAKWMPPAYVIRNAGRFINMDATTAEELIRSTDKRRAVCYEFITGEKWGDLERFDFHLVGNDHNLDAQTDSLLKFIRERETAIS